MVPETEEDYKRKEGKIKGEIVGLSRETFDLLWGSRLPKYTFTDDAREMTPEEFEEQRKKNARAVRALEMGGSESAYIHMTD